MITIASFIALGILSCLTALQLALICGAPLGKLAWGGKYTRLPYRLRLASLVSIGLYALFATFAAMKAGIIPRTIHEPYLTIGIWMFTAYFFIGIAMNAVSRSKSERNTMTPTAALLAITFLLIAVA